AKLLIQQDDAKSAAAILSKPAIKAAMDADMSFVYLDALLKTGQKSQANLLAPQLLRKYPEQAKQSLPLAVLFYESNNRGKAKEILEAYNRTQDSEEGQYYLGKVYYEEKSYANAARALEKGRKFKPDALPLL